MSRVFFFEKVKHDISGSKKYGKPVYLMREGESRTSLFDNSLVDDLINKLEDYSFNANDFIAVTGQLNQVTLLVAAVTERFNDISILLFDARDGCYHEVVLNPKENNER